MIFDDSKAFGRGQDMARRMLDPATMYRALVDRDPALDGVFFVGVKTTGIFCRTTCPAKKPRPENVEYFPSIRAAVRAGYRACRRCRPMDVPGKTPEWVRRLLDRVDQEPASRLVDADLVAMQIEPTRARRYFTEHYGMTFHAYHRARRMGLALGEIRDGGDVLDVGMKHGYDSTSGFRGAFARHFGDPPGRGREASCLIARWVETPLGPMLAAANDEGLALLEFIDRRAIEAQIATLCKHFSAAIVPGAHPHLDHVARELEAYFRGDLRAFTVPIIDPASPFQRLVWDALKAIPYGQTMSYAQIAAGIGRPGASRAVGRANGENRIGIVIPCHRVVRADGSLCGYGGGVWRKRRLLELERETMQKD